MPTSQNFASLQICVKMFHSQLYLVATAFHMQYVCSPKCVINTYSSHYSDDGRSKKIKKVEQ